MPIPCASFNRVFVPPAQLSEMAHKAFTEYQAQMAPLAAEIAKEHHWSSTDYRDVIRELKKQQLVGDAILPAYQNRLREIEGIIQENKLVSLPERAAASQAHGGRAGRQVRCDALP